MCGLPRALPQSASLPALHKARRKGASQMEPWFVLFQRKKRGNLIPLLIVCICSLKLCVAKYHCEAISLRSNITALAISLQNALCVLPCSSLMFVFVTGGASPYLREPPNHGMGDPSPTSFVFGNSYHFARFGEPLPTGLFL